MKRSAFDQRLAKIAVQLNYSDVKMWMKLQNSKLCPGTWINLELCRGRTGLFYLTSLFVLHFLREFLFNNNSKDSSEIWIFFFFPCHPRG